MYFSSPPASAVAAAGTLLGATLLAPGAAAGAGAAAVLGFSAGLAVSAGAWILSTTACNASVAGAAAGLGSRAKSLAASRAASLLPYIGLFGSETWPAVGSAALPDLLDLSVNGVEPLV